MNINFICNTDGQGFWTTCKHEVRCVKLEPDAHVYDNDPVEEEQGELRVHFDSSWVVASHGLIYTDDLFIAELREQLAKLGFNAASCEDVHYSEQGMQGRHYVSFDIGHAFLQEYRRVSGEDLPTQRHHF